MASTFVSNANSIHMKKITSTIFLLGFVVALHAQIGTAWTATYNNVYNRVDYGREIALDAAGNVYVAGHSLIDQDQHSVTIVVKYNAAGQQQWAFNSNPNEIMEDFKVDAQGNSYFTGYFWQNNAYDFYTVKLDPSGNVAWSATYNGTGNYWDQAFSISVDNSGNVFVCGSSKGVANGYDFVTIKYNSTGQQQWVARYAPTPATYFNDPHQVVVDNSGNCYTTGYSYNGSTHDMIVLKYDAAGNQQWLQSLPTNTMLSQVSINYLKVDPTGNIFVLGSCNNPTTGGDVRLVHYSAAGALLWQHDWSSAGHDSDYVGGDYYSDNLLALDNTGHIYVAGVTEDPTDLFSQDIFLLRYDTAGTFDWMYSWGGIANDEDRVFSMAVDNNNGVYLTGEVSMFNAIGSFDYVTMKVNAVTGQQQWIQTFNGTVNFYDEAHAITVDQQGDVYVTGYSSQNADILDPRSDMVTIKYSATVGIAEPADQMQLSVYPNPANDQATIIFIVIDPAELQIDLTDVEGRVVQTVVNDHYSPGPHTLTLSTAALAPGLYFCRMRNGQDARTTRVLVQH